MSNILDTRDLAERLEELRELQNTYEDALENLNESERMVDNFDGPTDSPELIKLEAELQAAQEALNEAELDAEDLDELDELEDISDEIGSEWSHGVQLIPEDDFVDYCQELCEDIGDIPKYLPGYIVIDWDATCNNLRQDYSEIEFRGETYLYRV